MPDSPAHLLRVLPTGPEAWPLFGTESSRAIEKASQARLPAHALMHRAGWAVARLALAVAPHARRIWVAAGPGNNGGDGLDAAIHLKAAGKLVDVTWLGDEERLPRDAADALARARAAGLEPRVIPADAPPPAADLIIDALLGLGTSRTPQGPLADTIALINRSQAPVLSVDLPSGLPADTGWIPHPLDDSCCVRADHTLCLLTVKPGLFTSHGRDHAGTVWFDALGTTISRLEPTAWLSPDPGPSTPRLHAQHKGSFGNVAVIGGAPGMAGAALLAARAALHAGAGRVFVQTLDAQLPPMDPAAPELMLRREIDLPGPAGAELTVVCGCGGGSAIREKLPVILSRAARLVLDADALNALAADPGLQPLLAQRADRGWDTVLTPHPLEAARLLDTTPQAVQSDRLTHARELARRFQCIVVLKGSGSVVAGPNLPPWINPTGNAALGTAGTGDVLAGWIGALWAQGRAAEHAAREAVYWHGAQADEWGQHHPLVPLTAGGLARGAGASR